MTTTNPYDTIIDSNADEAYERVLPEAQALDERDLLQVNIDLTPALVTAMGIVAKLPQLEESIRQLPAFPVDKAEKFSDYLLALLSAQSRHAFAVLPPKQDPALLEEGVKLRDILMADAEALITRGLLEGGTLRELNRGQGYRNVGFDIEGLARVMKTAWPTIEGHTGLTAAELAEADRLALRLMATVARREQSPEAIAEATTIRQRMYTLFYGAYDQLRRAASYLRWAEDDVDDFVPSIFAGRSGARGGRRNGHDDANEDTGAQDGGAGGQGAGGQGAGGQGAGGQGAGGQGAGGQGAGGQGTGGQGADGQGADGQGVGSQLMGGQAAVAKPGFSAPARREGAFGFGAESSAESADDVAIGMPGAKPYTAA